MKSVQKKSEPNKKPVRMSALARSLAETLSGVKSTKDAKAMQRNHEPKSKTSMLTNKPESKSPPRRKVDPYHRHEQ